MDKSGGGFLAQGGYGCVYYPEVNCQGKDTNNKNFLSKIVQRDFSADNEINIGDPTIEGAKVEAKILNQTKNKTILVFKKRRRQNSRRKKGHRQKISVVQILKIFGKNGQLLSEANKKIEVGILAKAKIKNAKEE